MKCTVQILYFGLLIAWQFEPSALQQSPPIVHLKQGALEGKLSKATNGDDFLSFTTIPFAESPVEELRFQKPRPHKGWNGVRTSNEAFPSCPQRNMKSPWVKGQEDCLYLNVYTKSVDGSRPVLFYIHGGGYLSGSASPSFLGPEFIMNQDAIFVAANYRLGALGFLSTLDAHSPGNAGLWDQLLALQWVHENIHHFGGDPNKVTIMGLSAGGMSVMHHVFSPQSAGLFRAVIAQSGVASSTFGRTDKHPAYYARQIAEKVGCDPSVKENEALISCLKTVSASELASASAAFQKYNLNSLPFKPIVDGYSTVLEKKDAFLPEDPWDMLQNGKFNQVPIMLGSTRDEGLLFAGDFVHFPENVKHLFANNRTLLPFISLFRDEDEVDAATDKFVNDAIAFFFAGEIPNLSDPSRIHRIASFTGDPTFNMINSITANMMAGKSREPIYEYVYDYSGTISLTDILIDGFLNLGLRALTRLFGLDPFEKKYGISHGDDMFVLFDPLIYPINGRSSDSDEAVANLYLEKIANFVMSLNPNGEKDEVIWNRIEPTSAKQYHIDVTPSFKAYSKEYSQRYQFWLNTFKQLPPTLHHKDSSTWKNPERISERFGKGLNRAQEEL